MKILTPMTEDKEYVSWKKNNSLEIRAWFATGRHFRREEYLLYDYNSFIADVGGYLGLLLGHSMLSLFCDAADWFKPEKIFAAIK